MPPKVLKTSEYNCSETLTKLFNDTINNCEFSDELKLAGDPTKSKNCRPMSVLPTVSKIFERITHSQMSIFVQKFLCP